ncbi:hypothetical protein PQQ51_04210 [Paraburkholderia xenovorans]|uniref:hypothetical protein n=1 Tax=Paraburkholderia xenovorans TaxID=36873 RepID=UPI0038BA6CB6
MNHEPIPNETESAILLRMAASREALLVANRTPPSVPVVRGQTRPAVATLVTSLAEAPRVTLLLALCVSAIVLGPRRTIGVAGRSGIATWLGGTVRKAFRQTA